MLINHGERLDYGATNTPEHSRSSSSNNFEHNPSRLQSHTSPLLTCGLLYGSIQNRSHAWRFWPYQRRGSSEGSWSADQEVWSKEDVHRVVPRSPRLLYSVSSHAVFRSTFG